MAPQKPAKTIYDPDPPPWDEAPADTIAEGENNLAKPAKLTPDKSLGATAWHEVIPQLGLEGRAAELIKHCLLESKDNGIICLLLDKSSEGLLAETVRQQIEMALSDFYGQSLKLLLNVAEETTTPVNPVEASKENETPAQRSARLKSEKQQQAEQNIINDPFVIELQSRFGAQLVPGSVYPK